MPQALSNDTPPTVTILMAVYNGAEFLDAQLESIHAQTHRDWRVVASDDGSSDGSMALLHKTAQNWEAQGAGALDVIPGPQKGAAENFMSMLRHVQANAPDTGWIAFSDQDDIWLPDKLARAQAALSQQDPAVPALYCGRTLISDAGSQRQRLSAPRPRPPGFRNALVQNIASGNTIVLNPAGTRMVLEAATRVGQVVVHDWWVYQLITGAGGTVVHDDAPVLLYRQHAGNEIGANDGIRAKLKRIYQLLRGDFQQWNQINIIALNSTADLLGEENRRILAEFESLSKRALWPRLMLLKRLGLYRQSLSSTAALWLAAILGKL